MREQTMVQSIAGILAWSLLCASPSPIWQHNRMNYFEAVGVFYAFMDSKPCWQPLNEVWLES